MITRPTSGSRRRRYMRFDGGGDTKATTQEHSRISRNNTGSGARKTEALDRYSCPNNALSERRKEPPARKSPPRSSPERGKRSEKVTSSVSKQEGRGRRNIRPPSPSRNNDVRHSRSYEKTSRKVEVRREIRRSSDHQEKKNGDLPVQRTKSKEVGISEFTPGVKDRQKVQSPSESRNGHVRYLSAHTTKNRNVSRSSLLASPNDRDEKLRDSRTIRTDSKERKEAGLKQEAGRRCSTQSPLRGPGEDDLNSATSTLQPKEAGNRENSRYPSHCREDEAPILERPSSRVSLNGNNDQADRTHSFNEYGYEVDSQFPSPPHVTFARLSYPGSLPLEPLATQAPALFGPEQDADTWSPTYAEEPTATNMFPSDNQSITTSLMPDDPSHPDHLAYLLSTAQITPVDDDVDQYEYTEKHYERQGRARTPSYDAPRAPDTPSRSLSRRYHHVGYEDRAPSPIRQWDPYVPDQEDIDYEAEGRAWMEQVRRRAETAPVYRDV